MRNRLRLQGVTKRFGGRLVVSVEELELGLHGIEGLIGPNGAGKTTLMNLITRKLKPDGGTVRYGTGDAGDIDISRLKVDQIARLGVVKSNQLIQDFESLTIRESMLLSLARPEHERFHRLFSDRRLRQEVAHEIDTYLQYFHFEQPDGHALSAGEKKILDIIRCLLLRPKILLMDEPTAGLPEDQTRLVMELMKRKSVEDELAIIIVEHDLGLIWEVCQFVHFMGDGEVLVQGPPEVIRASPIVAEKYLGSSHV